MLINVNVSVWTLSKFSKATSFNNSRQELHKFERISTTTNKIIDKCCEWEIFLFFLSLKTLIQSQQKDHMTKFLLLNWMMHHSWTSRVNKNDSERFRKVYGERLLNYRRGDQFLFGTHSFYRFCILYWRMMRQQYNDIFTSFISIIRKHFFDHFIIMYTKHSRSKLWLFTLH